jgi:O-antigen/teichoic acid export membrane protein
VALPRWAVTKADVSSPQAAKNAGINVLSGAFRFIASLGTAIILGRLLSPNDFGLVGMVLPIVAFLLILSDSGISNYILQHKSCGEKVLNAAFCLSSLMVITICILLVLFSGSVAEFYNEPELQTITVFASFSIFLTIFTATHNALVKKYQRQDIFAISEIIGSIFASVIPVILAFYGAGYWSLVSIPIFRCLGHSISIWYLTRWVPGFVSPGGGHYDEMVKFSSVLLIYQIFTVIGKNIDKVVAGYAFGANELGYYTMAVNLMLLPAIQILTPVGGALIPYFSSIYGREGYFGSVLAASLRLGFVVLPLMITAAIYSHEIITLVLGDKWAPTGEIFFILAFVSLIYVYESVLTWSVIGAGKPKVLAKWVFLSTGMTLIAVFVGAQYSTLAIAYGLLVSSVIVHILYAFYVTKHLDASVASYFNYLLKVVLFATLFGGFQYGTKVLLDGYEPGKIVSLLLGLLLCLIYALSFITLIYGRKQLVELGEFLKYFVRRG